MQYVITDKDNNTATSPTNVVVAGPPSITAPTGVNLTVQPGATNAPYQIPSVPAAQYCGHPECTTKVLYNGVFYNPNDTVNIPIGTNTPLTWVTTDATGAQAASTSQVNVVGPPQIQAPAPQTVNTTGTNATYTLQPPASLQCTNPQVSLVARHGNSQGAGLSVLAWHEFLFCCVQCKVVSSAMTVSLGVYRYHSQESIAA